MCGFPLPLETPVLQAVQMNSFEARWVLCVMPDLEKVMDSLRALPSPPCRRGLPLVEPWRTLWAQIGAFMKLKREGPQAGHSLAPQFCLGRAVCVGGGEEVFSRERGTVSEVSYAGRGGGEGRPCLMESTRAA